MDPFIKPLMIELDDDPEARRELSWRLLLDFAESTGVTADRPPRRYLWTDAFAVCGFLGLAAERGEPRYLEIARHLVDQVHRVLGHHRDDDARTGWISGLDRAEGARHPTAGGLRIGKPEPERAPNEPLDSRREWDRDGQYYHYLTRWMVALAAMAAATGEDHFHRWAVELARTAHRAFVVPGDDAGRGLMRWKMSIDLSRPLVPSMGQHDPLDGRITVALLQASARGEATVLEREASELETLCRNRSWTTSDPLGTGGLLVDGLRLVQLDSKADSLHPPIDPGLRHAVFHAAVSSLETASARLDPDMDAGSRLAFRELGLALGIRGAQRVEPGADLPDEWRAGAEARVALAEALESFWSRPASRTVRSWTDHRDINDVTLALALSPEGYLTPPW